MQPAQRECGDRERVVVLHESAGDAKLVECLDVVSFSKPAPRISVAAWPDDHWKSHAGSDRHSQDKAQRVEKESLAVR